MPIEESGPNPAPPQSLLPDSILDLNIKLDNKVLSDKDIKSIRTFQRAANYVAGAMIFLQDNVLLRRPLKKDDIKNRLLGHWGTCPGLNLIYAHANHLIKTKNVNMIFVTGPGHGAPAILASLWLENSLHRFYPQYARNQDGLANLIKGFSWPGGFPSHVSPNVPGSIHEGGELGYALAVSWGAVMDNPDLIVTCVVGDGEAETGPTATAWHSHKYVDPKESGAVIPILHVNGFKISERTIFGCMDDRELTALFTGYGYQVRIVDGVSDGSNMSHIDQDLAASMAWAYDTIKDIQTAARSGKPIMKPRFPVIILRTPKGWGGPKAAHGTPIEGTFHAHQVPLPTAKTDDEEFKLLDSWLKSYGPEELFNEDGSPIQDALQIVPDIHEMRMGQRKETYANWRALDVPDFKTRAVEKGEQTSPMKQIGNFLGDVMEKNPTSVRLFSPDELMSNKLDGVFKYTQRNFQVAPESAHNGGRVIEVLSEHCCQGWMQGYVLTGRTGIFPSYESFLGIIHTMMVQYGKFMKIAKETAWRGDVGSINYIETSTWARQEHNGFSHQNPSFIGAVMNLKPEAVRVYLPPDANCAMSTIGHMLRSKNYINLLVGSKQPVPTWLSPDEAEKHCIAGASIWKFASTDDGVDPDVVLVGIGVEVTFEVITAAALLRKKCPELRVRVVNVTDLMILAANEGHPHALTNADFDALFTKDRPVHFNYHGYPGELKSLLFGRPGLERVSIEGYREEGTTTTPFDMMVQNHVSRYHVAMHALRGGALRNKRVALVSHELCAGLQHDIQKLGKYIVKHGEDPADTYDTPVFE
ncbi:phosphoketolase [Saitoella complicata NRRL Y-17804]|uniref:Xylulose 5-phosphate/Fructose 6-phosphate phosphoketolase N-terminal domain-containing protein n=1 Tax=Saitoella complicata (strain BCRC 22490 / CBS 7301 / JCM 7358 / NBRC 10748 / NRRL Y-17804) TaxID=698492 RepID=A0A0E9N9L4_SAICN|nr:phosphoketolase [Saitoella complicata NRRL Y-17804]ODQ56541.1 phosphoketolase [Saitoella complicata NRRL Y-17804]GAO46483.1 hypothetical protein G7K_0714-t1 [Saitoella complicata NRRL Y-17804]